MGFGQSHFAGQYARNPFQIAHEARGVCGVDGGFRWGAESSISISSVSLCLKTAHAADDVPFVVRDRLDGKAGVVDKNHRLQPGLNLA